MPGMQDAIKGAGLNPSGSEEQRPDRQRGHGDAPFRSHSTTTDCAGQSYFDEEGHLLLKYVSRRDVEPIVVAFSQDRPPLNMHQLNRFFRYCRTIEGRLIDGTSPWEQERVNVAKLSSFAADAFGKNPRKIPESFRRFIDCNADRASSERAFRRGFMEHFEAVLGFAALHLRDR